MAIKAINATDTSRRRLWLALILATYVTLAITYSLVTPLFEASDELWHYPMVKYVADHNFALPVQQAGRSDAEAPWRQEGGQPPLYYYLGAALTFWIDTGDLDAVRRINPHANIGEVVPDGNANVVVHDRAREAWPWSGAVLALRLVRFLSVALGAGTVLLTYLLGRALLPDQPAVALVAAALVAFNPMFLFVSAVINNDNLSNLLATALLLLVVRLLKRADDPPGWRFYVLLGVTAGAGMLAKFQIGFMLPVIALVLLAIALRNRNWRPVVVGGAISGGLTIVIAGWWYWRNYNLYGDATGINVFLDIVGRRAVPADLHQLWTERETFMMAFWGLFGAVNVPLPDAWYTGFNLIALAGALGLLAGLGREIALRIKTRTCPPAPVKTLYAARMLNALWAAIVFVSLLAWTRQTWASQGRLWFSALAPLMIGLAAGLMQWPRLLKALHSAGQRIVSPLAVGFFLAAAIAAPFVAIRPAYTLDRDATWQTETLESGPFKPACFRAPDAQTDLFCIAYRELSGAIQPGQYLKLAPTITAKQAPARDWSLFVHLVSADGIIEAQRDVYPGGGLIATSDLAPGDAWNNLVAVPIPPGTYTPQTLDVYLGFYDLATFERLIPQPPARSDDNRLWLGQITLETPPGDVPNPVDVNFAGKLTLRGFTVSDRALHPGDETTVTLYWQAHEALADYVISVQVIDPDPARLTKAAQHDAPPDPPTTQWAPGEIVTEHRALAVFPDAPPGRYRLMVRVYPAGDPSATLRVRGEAGGQSQDYAWLSWIQVETP